MVETTMLDGMTELTVDGSQPEKRIEVFMANGSGKEFTFNFSGPDVAMDEATTDAVTLILHHVRAWMDGYPLKATMPNTLPEPL